MSDQDSGRKTLTINKRSESFTASSDGKPRVRIGARARQVAQQKIAKDKAARLKGENPEPTSERSASRSTDRDTAAGAIAP
jgi:hypothetical protein